MEKKPNPSGKPRRRDHQIIKDSVKKLRQTRAEMKKALREGILQFKLTPKETSFRDAVIIFSSVSAFCRQNDIGCAQFRTMAVVAILGQATWRDMIYFGGYISERYDDRVYEKLRADGYVMIEKVKLRKIFYPTLKAKKLLDKFIAFNKDFNKKSDEFAKRGFDSGA